LSMASRLFIPNPYCVRPAPMMLIGAPRETLVSCQDRYPVGPAEVPEILYHRE
jgi:hypothetical protein